MTTSSMHDNQEDSRSDQTLETPAYPSDSHPPWPFPTNTRTGSSSSSAQMIGPTSTFYDPEAVATHDPQSPDYQAWLESYRTHHDQQPIYDPTLQSQYTFVSSQFSRPSPANIAIANNYPQTHAQPPQLAHPSPASTLRGAVPYHQQGPDMYFYPHNVSDHPQQYDPYSTPPMPKSTPTATTFTSPPSRSTPSSTTMGTYAGSTTSTLTGYTPSPDLLALPQSHSHSSVSPSSWTEESMYSSASAAAAPQLPPVAPAATRTRTPPKQGPTSTKRSKPSPRSTQKGKRKRQKKNEVAESDSGSEDDFDTGMLSTSIGGSGLGGPDPVVPSRLQGACTVCKRLKMKCDFPPGENTCKRCKAGGHLCVVEGRKARTAPNKREYLMAQLRQKDSVIENLLKQLHNPYRATPLSIASYRMATSPTDQNNRNVVDWLDQLQSNVRTAGESGGTAAFRPESRVPGPGRGADDSSESDHGREDPFGLGYAADGADGGDAEGEPQDPEKLQTLPDASVPLGLIANLAISNTKAKQKKKGGRDAGSDGDQDDDDNVGVANERYFMPGPASDLTKRASLIERHSAPEILVHGLVVASDVDKLFDIFYTRVNPFVSLLDPVLHTPASTFARCPFLFTVICAVSSRYYAEKSEIYPIAMHFAKHSAANALIDGWKSVELCQAYILMSIYAVPAKKWEEDRSWLYTGLAIRLATDLNLHQVSTVKPQNERQEREVLNRTRVWLICFNLDRSTATQFGKPVTIKEDYIVRQSRDWYKQSQYNLKYDVHLCAYSSLLRIVARFHDDIFSDANSTTGLNRQVDFRAVTLMHDEHLTRYHDEWAEIFATESDPNDRGSAFRCTLLPFLVGYSRLVMFSFGFQQAYQRGIVPEDEILFTKCLDAAVSVVKNFVENLAPSGYMRFAPDGHFIFASFASAFLLKLLRPDFSNLLSKQQETDIFLLIGRLIQTLSSPEIAIDDRHTPRLYARFLAGLLTRHRRDGTTSQRQGPPGVPPGQSEAVTETTGTGSDGYGFPQGQQRQQQPQDPPPRPPSQPPLQAQDQEMTEGGYTHAGLLFGNEGGLNMFDSLPGTVFADLAVFGDGGLVKNLTEEEMLATMHALKNPAWLQNMMMPGWSWLQEKGTYPAVNGFEVLTSSSY